MSLIGIKVGMVSLGCSKNRVDSEEILGELASRGAIPVSDPDSAEVIIVNTCGFIESAKTDSLDTIFEMAQFKESGACRLLVVCGCLSERYYDELKEELPEADLIWGVKDHSGLAEAIEQRLTGDISSPCCASRRVITTPPYRAYLRIADGCDNRCTYCAIPLIRGGRVSRPMEELIEEARGLAEQGVTGRRFRLYVEEGQQFLKAFPAFVKRVHDLSDFVLLLEFPKFEQPC